MLSLGSVSHWLIALVGLTQSVVAVPGKAPPPCGGNVCYPVLVGPLVKDIAQDFCSYYLHYPKTTTVIVKGTSTATKTSTLPASTVKTTAIVSKTTSTTTSTTSTAPGSTITSTVTETVTVNAMEKRSWTPPKGSGDGYKPPALAPFAPSIISAACSCLITPTTKTVTSASVATATTIKTESKLPTTTTVATTTVTITSTITVRATVTDPPTTTITTTTTPTTLAPPEETCNGEPSSLQRGVRGFITPFVAPDENPVVESGEQCYDACKALGAGIKSYEYRSATDPGTPNGPPIPFGCRCFAYQLCEIFERDPAGNGYAGDIQLPF